MADTSLQAVATAETCRAAFRLGQVASATLTRPRSIASFQSPIGPRKRFSSFTPSRRIAARSLADACGIVSEHALVLYASDLESFGAQIR
jgi:hypothetical protein